MTDRQRFDSIRRRWLTARDREHAIRGELARKYGRQDPPRTWLTKTEEGRLDRARHTQQRASDAMFWLLEDVSPRSWMALVPHHWVMESLTWEDATTAGVLSVVPPCGYGACRRDMEELAGAVSYLPSFDDFALDVQNIAPKAPELPKLPAVGTILRARYDLAERL